MTMHWEKIKGEEPEWTEPEKTHIYVANKQPPNFSLANMQGSAYGSLRIYEIMIWTFILD